MSILKDGTFTKLLGAKDLLDGLKPFSNTVRNSSYLTSCQGVVADNVSLRSITDLSTIDTSLLGCVFPYPQLFVCTRVILICTPTKIYEYISGSLILKITTTAYQTWTMLEYFDFIFLSNGLVSITRDPGDHVYSLVSSPITDCACDFNGQAIISGSL